MLGMDKNGNIYETASHRHDGKGFERSPSLSGIGDLALESPYAKSARSIEKEHDSLRKLRIAEDLQSEKSAMLGKIRAAKLGAIRRTNVEVLLSPQVQKAMTREAALQGLGGIDFSQMSTDISGYGLSADGTRGMSAKQKAYERAALQGYLGEAPADDTVPLADTDYERNVSAEEQEQILLAAEAEAMKQQTNALVVQPSQAAVDTSVQQTSLPQAIQPPGVAKQIAEAQAAQAIAQAQAAQAANQSNDSKKMKKAITYGVIGLVLYKVFLK